MPRRNRRRRRNTRRSLRNSGRKNFETYRGRVSVTIVLTNGAVAADPFNGNNAIDIRPGDFAGDRIKAVASTYSQYRFVSCKFSYRALCSSSTNGGLSLGVMADPEDSITINSPSVLNCAASVYTQVFHSASFTYVPPRTQWYYCLSIGTDPADVRLGSQMILVGNLDNSAVNTNYGEIYLDYVIAFRNSVAVETISTARPMRFVKPGLQAITSAVSTPSWEAVSISSALSRSASIPDPPRSLLSVPLVTTPVVSEMMVVESKEDRDDIKIVTVPKRTASTAARVRVPTKAL